MCAVFTKLASQLTAKTLSDLAIIPFIFLAQTVISWACSWIMSKVFRFEKRPKNFVTAMAVSLSYQSLRDSRLTVSQVFGNSNSLPISLVISLSKTISGLHWSAIPGDNDDEVASRGILYLLIFQQLGQLVRWTWGYNILLAPREAYEEDARPEAVEEATTSQSHDVEANDTQPEERFLPRPSDSSEDLIAGERTPINHRTRIDSSESSKTPSIYGSSGSISPKKPSADRLGPDSGDEVDNEEETDLLIPLPNQVQDKVKGARRRWHETLKIIHQKRLAAQRQIGKTSAAAFHKLPAPFQRFLRCAAKILSRFASGVWEFMNPPLWAMLAAILVASIPRLQHVFFTRGSFIHNTFTRGVSQSGGVAVPLILVVLGANLARNTLPSPGEQGVEECDRMIEGKLLLASIVSRMLLPTVFMAPLIALAAKYLPISILDDPIFVIVCFLLTGAPSALQLAQICQINNVYVGAMSRLLFQSYVVW